MLALTPSDWIEVIGILSSLIVSTIAVVISICALRQNSKMIAESTRPYIVVYYDRITLSLQQGFIVIKNFGQTGAIVTKFEPNVDLEKGIPRELKGQFKCAVGLFLAPGQNKLFYFEQNKLNSNDICIKIEYSALGKTYTDTFCFNAKNFSHIPTVRPHSNSGHQVKDELRDISCALQELIDRKL